MTRSMFIFFSSDKIQISKNMVCTQNKMKNQNKSGKGFIFTVCIQYTMFVFITLIMNHTNYSYLYWRKMRINPIFFLLI